ncbi:hypothetical protein [Hungatella sp.]|uniref:hypothetical protein n=1 Tax=Hungatella sp. TaxID=2613924 RepID=UPI002A7F4AB7|nr:hypothetical protein [Hungatella sp.]
MLRTTYLNLKKPEGSDPVNVQDFNDNADTIDTEVNARVKSSGGDIANTKVSAFTASTASYPVPAAGETPKVFMGKIKKFFEDFKSFKDSIVTKTMILNQILNDSTKAASAATVYSVNEKVDSAISDLAYYTCGIDPQNGATIADGYAKRKGDICMIFISGVTCTPHTVIGKIRESMVKSDIWFDIDDQIKLNGRDIVVKNVSAIDTKMITIIDTQ